MSVDSDGLRGIHCGQDGESMNGFVLLGAKVKERMSLAVRLPGPLTKATLAAFYWSGQVK